MDTPINKFFKPGIVHFMAFPHDLNNKTGIVNSVKKIASDEYFEVIELTFINDQKTKKLVSDVVKSSGIEVLFGSQPVLLGNNLNVNSEDENTRQQSIKVLKQCINQACELGAEGLSFLSGRYDEGSKNKAFELLIDSTEDICEYAKEKNLLIELEVFDFDIDKKSLIGPVSMARSFAERIRKKYDNFGLLVDLSHLPLLREKPAQAIIPVKDFITHIHIGNCFISDKNSPLYGDYHPPFGLPGSEIDTEQVAEFLQVFIDTGFFDSGKRIPLSFEVKPLSDQDPDIIISNSKRTLNRAWLLVQ